MQSYRFAHAHADRVVLMPTGDTQPKGTVFVSDYELVLLQVGYAPTDRLQLAVGGFTDFGKQGVFDFTLKASLHRSPWLRIAALASADYLHAGRQALLAGRVGGAGQLCFEPACRSSATLASFVVLTDLPSVLFPIAVSAGMIARVSEAFSLLFEYSTFWNASTRLSFIDQSLFLLSYGLRIAGNTQWEFDLCFLRTLATSSARDTAPFFRLFGAPFVAITYRFQP